VAHATGARANPVEERVLLAVHPHFHQVEDVTRGLALAPQLVARRGPEHRAPRGQGLAQRQRVGVADEQHLAAVRVLEDHRQHVLIALRNLAELLEIQRRGGALFQHVHGRGE
jgi:hypothetical protein